MKSRRSYFSRGILAGIFIAIAYSSIANGSFITASVTLAVIAILFNGALGGNVD